MNHGSSSHVHFPGCRSELLGGKEKGGGGEVEREEKEEKEEKQKGKEEEEEEKGKREEEQKEGVSLPRRIKSEYLKMKPKCMRLFLNISHDSRIVLALSNLKDPIVKLSGIL